MVISQHSAGTCRVEKTLLEHVESLHVDLFEDKLRVVPGVDIHHVFVSDWDGDRPTWATHELRHVQVAAKVLVDYVLIKEAQVEHDLVVLTQLLELLQLLVIRSKADLVSCCGWLHVGHLSLFLLVAFGVTLTPRTTALLLSDGKLLAHACGSFGALLQVVAIESFSKVKTCLLWKALLCLFNCSSIENFIRVKVVCKHLLEFVIDLLM